jgi:hypothetical protein
MPSLDPDQLPAQRVPRYRPPPAGSRRPGSDRHTTGDGMGAIRSTEELQEALQLVVAAYRDIGPPPADDGAVDAWAQEYGRIAYLAEQLTGVGGRFALGQLRRLAAERRGNPRP